MASIEKTTTHSIFSLVSSQYGLRRCRQARIPATINFAAGVLHCRLSESRVSAITRVLAGELVLDSHLTSAHEAESKRACGLTARELQILRLIVHGKPGKDIADLLGISINTISSHRTRIGRTLGCSNSAELVAYAIRKGLVAIP